MEGFLKLSIPNWMRRLITRSLAVIPVLVCLIIFRGNESKMGINEKGNAILKKT
jgi:manganese transport protein